MAGLLVVVQATVLTVLFLPAPHTGGDNAGYLALAHALVEGHGYVELWAPDHPAHTKYPPGYPALLGLLMLAGASSWAAFKLFSAVGISLATLLAFAWAAGRVGPLGAGAVGLLLVLAGGWQDASRWILSEPWFLFWTFLCLWACDRGLAGLRGEPASESEPEPEGRSRAWLVLAGIGALMAFGVRSAGLPIMVAFGLALLVARRTRKAAVFAVGAAVLVGAWGLRAVRGGEGAYQSEFWLRNPYDPELGTVGMTEMLGRVWENLLLYLTRILPGEWWVQAPEWVLALLGLLMASLALWGWLSRLRLAAGAAEFFLPLYGAMLLLWPEVWSGERFLLPLLPLVLVYAGSALSGLAGDVAREVVGGGRRRGTGGKRAGTGAAQSARGDPGGPGATTGGGVGGMLVAVGTLALALPSLPGTLENAELAEVCRSRVAVTGDVFSCHGRGFVQFRQAAAWMGHNLPEGARALSRKPRILHVLGGPPGRTFPFVRDPDRFLAGADAVGARYLLVDRLDGIAARYLPGVIQSRPGAFCYVSGWGEGPDDPGTLLLGILPPEERTEGVGMEGIGRCPERWTVDREVQPTLEGMRVPILMPPLDR